jgi:hypothetical protein
LQFQEIEIWFNKEVRKYFKTQKSNKSSGAIWNVKIKVVRVITAAVIRAFRHGSLQQCRISMHPC